MEAAGSLGDLGTFIPIVVGMVQIVGLDAGAVLVFAGLMNIISGLIFRIPIAVQPMKAIAALAIAGIMSSAEVGIAGLTAGLVMILLGGFGLINKLGRIIPRPVLRGFQMTVAFKLFIAGGALALFDKATDVLRPLWGGEGLIVAAVGVVIIVLLYKKVQWMALALVFFGFAAAVMTRPALLQACGVTFWRPQWVLSDFSGIAGVWRGGIPQIPLTLLNSVLAVSVLAGQLFPESRKSTAPARIAVSVGLMNLLCCPFGGMPLCHGSGGLAGQHRLGARTGLSMVMLGSAKLIVGLLFGAAALAWMQAFPAAILGVFLFIAGASLANASRCWQVKTGLITAASMIIVSHVTGVLLLGFIAGWIVHALLCVKQSLVRGARLEQNDVA